MSPHHARGLRASLHHAIAIRAQLEFALSSYRADIARAERAGDYASDDVEHARGRAEGLELVLAAWGEIRTEGR